MSTNNLYEPDDLELDLLVDDELPETQRVQVLRAMDATPERWRNLAIRFMQRQVERTAIRQLMVQNAMDRRPAAATRTLPFKTKSAHQFRMAAAFVLTAGLAAFIALYAQRHQETTNVVPIDNQLPQTASFNVSVPSQPLTGSNGSEPDLNLPVSVVQPKSPPDIRQMVLDTPLENGASRHVVIAPNGNNSAVIFNVTNDNLKEVVY